ncbi:MAG: decaprenyl-phosphate phosphoribosyltransferase [Gemmatimonadetes bacterium]|nr:decaprenyl-phosphate phosphoribosyltransferase [Gemmatimonadota bacterium]
MRPLLRSLRPNQWIKSVFVLAPLVFSAHLLDGRYLLRSGGAFVLFCLMSSAVYLLNDIRDVESDRRHPEKRNRPIASGQLSPGAATTAAIVIALCVLPLAFLLSISFGWVLLAYGLMNVTYSLHLKHVVILDVMIIASGYLLRAIAGALVINVEISSWLILCTVLLALFMGFVKRRQELILLEAGAAEHRRILDEYTPRFLDQMIAVVTAGALVSYALYTMSPDVAQKLGTPHLNLTIPFVIYGLLRYLYLVYARNQGGNPSSTILGDSSLMINGGLWFLAVFALLYFK